MNRIKKIIRNMSFGIAFLICLMANTLCVMADSVLSSVTVSSTTGDYEAEGARMPDFIAPRGCELETEWISSEASLAPGKTITAQLTLYAEEGYRFSSNPTISVYGATISGKSVSDDVIILRVKYGPLQYKLGVPEQIAWASEKSSVVKWSAVKYATDYKVKVYQDDKVIREETVTTRSFDAGKYFNGDSEVYVSVTAVATSGANRQYIRQGEEAFVSGSDVDWEDRESTYGVWSGNRYMISDDGDDSVYAKGWVEIFGKWYFFSDNEALQTGWIQYDGKRYYSDSEGVMQVGWVKPKDSDSWFYFRTSGEMATGWLAAGAPGTWYYMGSDGAMKTGWIQDSQKQYFMGIDGKMLKGWQVINNNWHYFHDDGHMASSETVDGYSINGDGIWVR